MANTSFLQLTPIKFLIAVGGIYCSYLYSGVIMERLFSYDYSGQNRPKGSYEKFTFGFATFLFQNLLSWMLACGVNRFKYGQRKSSMDLKTELTIAACNFGSIYLAVQALVYVPFPVQAIMKSSKIISILIVSLLLGVKGHYTNSQYFCGFIITAGIVIFNLSDSGKHKGGASETSMIGIVAILISLFCDGYLGTVQTEAKKKYNPSQWDQMESINKWAGIMCLIVANVSFQMTSFVTYVLQHPLVIQDLFMLAILGTCGQVFIFYTLANFSPLILSIITTTRKFFTVVGSIIIYNHEVSGTQWLAIGLVFIGVFVEMLSGGKKHEKVENVQVNGEKKNAKAVNREESDAVRRNVAAN